MMIKFHRILVYPRLFILTIVFLSLNVIPQIAVASDSHLKPQKVWVMFADKGISSKYNKLDLPVYQPYIDEIIDLGANLCISSRWLNGITITAENNVIDKISRLHFVRSIESVVTYKAKFPKQEKRSAFSLAPSIPDSYYGMSATQIEQIRVDALHDKGFLAKALQ